MNVTAHHASATRIDVSDTRAWPDEPAGLGRGWQGWAWVWLQLRARELVAGNADVLDAIAERLGGQSGFARADHAISAVLGSGSYPVVAALAATVDDRFEPAFERALARWIGDCPETRPCADIMLGSAGALMAAAEIEGHHPGRIAPAFLERLQLEATRELGDKLELSDDDVTHLGFAHGIAGYLAALETGHAVFGLAFPPALRERCLSLIWSEQLCVEGDDGEDEFGLWPVVAGDDQIRIHGWCNGAPGMALAFLVCRGLTGGSEYAELAELALEATWQYSGGGDTLCCGAVGRALTLVEGYRATGDARWLERARALEQTITFSPDNEHTNLLYGRVGHELLRWRLAHPTLLPMPWLGRFSCNP